MSDPQRAELDAVRILEVFSRHEVHYVLIGGYAAQLYGASRPTTDVDITPDRERSNLERLAKALRELGAGIRVDELPEGLPFDTSAEALVGMRMLNLRTPFGDVDLTFEPQGTDGYDDLARNAVEIEVGQVLVRIAALDDIIRSKEAAGRPKDLNALPELYALNRRARDAGR
jgi:hypothetical protein